MSKYQTNPNIINSNIIYNIDAVEPLLASN